MKWKHIIKKLKSSLCLKKTGSHNDNNNNSLSPLEENKQIEELFANDLTLCNIDRGCKFEECLYGSPCVTNRDKENILNEIEEKNHNKIYNSNMQIPSNFEENTLLSKNDRSTSAGTSYDDSNTLSNMNVTLFEKYDSVLECKNLRKAFGEPFSRGVLIWEQRRYLWNMPTFSPNNHPLTYHTSSRVKFKKLPKSSYYKVYYKLIVMNEPLKDVLNLEDVIKVLDVGWREESNI